MLILRILISMKLINKIYGYNVLENFVLLLDEQICQTVASKCKNSKNDGLKGVCEISKPVKTHF